MIAKNKYTITLVLICRNSASHQRIIDENNEKQKITVQKLQEEKAMLEVKNKRSFRIFLQYLNNKEYNWDNQKFALCNSLCTETSTETSSCFRPGCKNALKISKLFQ